MDYDGVLLLWVNDYGFYYDVDGCSPTAHIYAWFIPQRDYLDHLNLKYKLGVF